MLRNKTNKQIMIVIKDTNKMIQLEEKCKITGKKEENEENRYFRSKILRINSIYI